MEYSSPPVGSEKQHHAWNARAKLLSLLGPRGREDLGPFTAGFGAPHKQPIFSPIKLSSLVDMGRGRSWGIGKKERVRNIRLQPSFLDPPFTIRGTEYCLRDGFPPSSLT